ncbi:MAG: dipicolinate synthase subunit B [Firmicutes bacterium]|nr:dipicolinate synthase subunit B [Dethiobacter sp.]MBS3888700.1 dipicolinate synthase subunit B [Bacillota bacterium]
MIAKRIGFALTASYCTFSSVLPEIRELTARGAQVIPIMSENAATSDTKFGQAAMWKEKILEVSRAHAIIETIVQAEPIGPGKLLDLLVVAPCTGNSLGKIANAITDSVVTMAVKAHLRNMRPVLIAVSTNDGLGLNAVNIGKLLNSKNVFFVPFSQDNPEFKQNSLVAHMNLIPDAVEHALRGLQLSPVLRGT